MMTVYNMQHIFSIQNTIIAHLLAASTWYVYHIYTFHDITYFSYKKKTASIHDEDEISVQFVMSLKSIRSKKKSEAATNLLIPSKFKSASFNIRNTIIHTQFLLWNCNVLHFSNLFLTFKHSALDSVA